MKSLERHNLRRYEEHLERESSREDQPTGIACDGCGEELICPDPRLVVGRPPKVWVQCSGCNFDGYLLI